MSMIPDNIESPDTGTVPEASVHRRGRRAVRIPRPESCGCGMPVAFDVGRKEFFCIGCGAARACTCRRSAWSSTDRPVNVV
jgi:hypothetical protein